MTKINNRNSRRQFFSAAVCLSLIAPMPERSRLGYTQQEWISTRVVTLEHYRPYGPCIDCRRVGCPAKWRLSAGKTSIRTPRNLLRNPSFEDAGPRGMSASIFCSRWRC